MNLEIVEDQGIFKKGQYRTCNFSYTTINFCDHIKDENYNILVMKDLFTATELSLTNCIEEAANIAIINLSKEKTLPLKIQFVLYSDTEKQWDIFDLRSHKFHYLGILSDIPTQDIYNKAERYINKIR